MLYFVCFPKGGFVENLKGLCTYDVRSALPFKTFKEADDFGREICRGSAYAILSNCIG